VTGLRGNFVISFIRRRATGSNGPDDFRAAVGGWRGENPCFLPFEGLHRAIVAFPRASTNTGTLGAVGLDRHDRPTSRWRLPWRSAPLDRHKAGPPRQRGLAPLLDAPGALGHERSRTPKHGMLQKSLYHIRGAEKVAITPTRTAINILCDDQMGNLSSWQGRGISAKA
jgi:hypothetical protein